MMSYSLNGVDSTEPKRAEEALRESEAKIRPLVDANIIGIFIWDFEGRIIEANDAFLRMVDYDREDLVSGRMRWTELTPQEWLDRDERRWVPELKVTGSLQPFEKAYFRKDGSRVPVLIGAATFEKGGNQGVAFVLDLTERKCAEQALQESEGKFRDYAETASDWFWEIGPDYKFTLLTENAFGSHSADRIGTACWNHALDLETEPEKWRLVRATLDSRKPFRDFVYCSAGRNGSPMYVKASGKPVFDANGEFRGYRGTGTDVTALMRAQEERERLRRAQAELAHATRVATLGELSASIAHEVNQPLASIIASGEAAIRWLDRDVPEKERAQRAIMRLLNEAQRASQVIRRIRELAKKGEPEMAQVDINGLVEDVVMLVHREAAGQRVAVRTQLASELPPVRGDRIQLQQVLINLAINGIQAMASATDRARVLVIRTQRHGDDELLVAVEDAGVGIAPENLARLFSAFYTTKPDGMGMGLSISRSIVEEHGGRVWATRNSGPGMTFQFAVSAHREQTAASSPVS
jgi:PAS domain S-box-containing protein